MNKFILNTFLIEKKTQYVWGKYYEARTQVEERARFITNKKSKWQTYISNKYLSPKMTALSFMIVNFLSFMKKNSIEKSWTEF